MDHRTPTPAARSNLTFRIVWSAVAVALVLRTAGRERGVIYDHLEFGRRLVSGSDLYAPFLDPKPLHPVYPPSFGLLTWPFTVLPEPMARSAWAILQVAALAAIGLGLAQFLRRQWPHLTPRLHVALAITAVLASRYILRDTHGGGGNLINLALAFGAVSLAGHGRSTAAMAALGISLATKPTAILCLPLLWLLGYRRVAIGSTIVAAGLLGIALAIHGQGLAPLEVWGRGTLAYAGMVDLFETPAGGFPPFSWMNQGLRCAIARYCGVVPAAHADQVPGFFAGLGLAPTSTLWIRHAATAGILATTFGAVWRLRRDPTRHPALIAATFAAALLLSPISWKAHHVALIPALFLLAVRMVEGTRWAWGLAIGYVATCVLGEAIVGKQFKALQQSLYLVTGGTIALWCLCLTRAFAPREPAR